MRAWAGDVLAEGSRGTGAVVRCRRGATCAGLAAEAGGACVEELLPWGRGRASAGRSRSDGRKQGVGGRTKLCGEGERRGGAWEGGGDGGTGWAGGGRTGAWGGPGLVTVQGQWQIPAGCLLRLRGGWIKAPRQPQGLLGGAGGRQEGMQGAGGTARLLSRAQPRALLACPSAWFRQ